MNKFLLLFILSFSILGCTPASKKALEETNQNVLAIAKHDQIQDEVLELLLKAQFKEKSEKLSNALKKDSKIIAYQAESTASKDVGIFNLSAIKNNINSLLNTALNIAGDFAETNPYLAWAGTVIGLLTTYFGSKQIVVGRRKQKVKKEVLKRQHPDDAKKYDDLVANVEKEIKEGKIKV